METTTTPCSACGHATASDKHWRSLPKPRTVRRRIGSKCARCHRGAGTTTERRQPVPRAIVLEDWNWLHETGELDKDRPLNERVRMAAPRMGMSVAALEQALYRAGIRNPVESMTGGARATEYACTECRKSASAIGEDEGHRHRLAKRLAAHPDSKRLREALAEVQQRLAEHVAWRDAHLEYDHTDMEVAA